MRLRFGPKAGKLTEVILLREPDYAEWHMMCQPEGALSAEFVRLKKVFDALPLKRLCQSPGCTKPATKASAYRGTSNLTFWCQTCDPYQSGAQQAHLSTIKTFDNAIRHVNFTFKSGYRAEKRAIIKTLAAAKGAPATLGEKAAMAFFG